MPLPSQREILCLIRDVNADKELSQALTERMADATAELWPEGSPLEMDHDESMRLVLNRAIENCPP